MIIFTISIFCDYGILLHTILLTQNLDIVNMRFDKRYRYLLKNYMILLVSMKVVFVLGSNGIVKQGIVQNFAY